MIAALLATLLSAAPPLAGTHSSPQVQGASPVPWDALDTWSKERLRFAVGLPIHHTVVHSPGGNAFGIGGELALEQRTTELAAQFFLQGGVAAQDENGRNSGIGYTALTLLARWVPLEGSGRYMLEGGVTVGRESSWAFCTRGADVDSDACRVVPARLAGGLVFGTAYLIHPGDRKALIGLDMIVKAPRPPKPARAAPLAFQMWFALAFGGVPW